MLRIVPCAVQQVFFDLTQESWSESSPIFFSVAPEMIITEKRGNVALVTLNRPKVAFSSEGSRAFLFFLLY